MRLCVVGSPRDSVLLRQKAAELTEKEVSSRRFAVLKERMLATVNDPSNPGVGIAAPQVGISRRLVAVQRFDKPGEPFEFYINPVIVHYSEEKVAGTEGCLSVPGLSGNVDRSTEIVVKYNEEAGFKEKMERVSGFTAVIFQHETDHINGVLYTDRLRTGPEPVTESAPEPAPEPVCDDMPEN